MTTIPSQIITSNRLLRGIPNGDWRPIVGALVLIGTIWASGFTVAATIELNPGTTTYDHHPSVSIAPDDGVSWVAWHTYHNGSDAVVARQIDQHGAVGPLHLISDGGSTHGPPTIVADTGGRAWIVWSTKQAARWIVMARRWQNGRWAPAKPLSNPKCDAIFPAAVRIATGRLMVAWSERSDVRFHIRGCELDDTTAASPTLEISTDHKISGSKSLAPTPVDAYRPVLVRHDDQVWAFWDQYGSANYSIHARQLRPTRGDAERVSPEGEYCLTPTAFSHSTGLHVAWLRKIDVTGGPGVISQWHTLHGAIRRGQQWIEVRDEHGKSEAAELTHGLMAQIAPRPIATGGYLGSRVRPMWQAYGDAVWLLWERKADHRGSTPRVAGELIGRPIHEGQWQVPLVLRDDRVDYHLVHAENRRDETFRVIASKLPRQAIRTYQLLDVDVAAAKPFAQEVWAGWSPVKLPITSEQTPRREITAAGKPYKLFWADLHCHNNLSADAEGEVDEGNHYARDRAGLDVVVFTNNDFYNVPLTQYEYELGNLFAASHTMDGEFLSLPGFEWTSRIPGVATAALSDSGNWLPPYRHRSYANHRSVIYPPTGGPLVHFTEVGNDIARLNNAVAHAGGLTLSQHPTFKLSGHPVEVGLELTSGWSNYLRRNPQLFHRSLDRGRAAGGARLGFVANGDSHRRAPGLSGALTGIYAEALTPAAVMDALRQRRCYATAGARIFVDARAGGAMMGQEAVAVGGRIELTLHVAGTRAITAAELLRDGRVVYQAMGNGDRELRTEFTDDDLAPGVHWYYWRISQADTAPELPGNLMAAHGHLAWSSPHWVVVE